ncbi:MAG: hypothetical protein HY040_14930 [Planctomycetes bacterium]|nr:hypothetical protein [Planctomycetota bacterium]
MSKQLMEVVLPRLARPLYKHLEKFQTGKLDESQFTEQFETLLRKQHQWLSRRGISAARAAIAIHAAVLVLSLPGLRAEANDANLPLEVVENRAVREAALDVASSYNLNARRIAHTIACLVVKYAE